MRKRISTKQQYLKVVKLIREWNKNLKQEVTFNYTSFSKKHIYVHGAMQA